MFFEQTESIFVISKKCFLNKQKVFFKHFRFVNANPQLSLLTDSYINKKAQRLGSEGYLPNKLPPIKYKNIGVPDEFI